MRAAVLAFLGGIWGLQQLPQLPPAASVIAFPLLLLAAYRYRWLRPLAVAAAGFCWAWWHAVSLQATALPPALEGKDLVLTGTVEGLPRVDARRTRFRFQVHTLTYQGQPRPGPARVSLSWYEEPPPLVPGEQWRLTVRLKRPHGFMNPGGFDYEGWLFREGLRARGYVRADGVQQRLAPTSGHLLDRARQDLDQRLTETLDGHPVSSVVTALAIGERHHMTSNQWQVLTATGTNHLVAISGLHVGLVAAIAFALVRWLWGWLGMAWPAPKAAAVAGLVAATLYAALAGFSIPTQRALIMVAVAMTALLMGCQRAPSQVLALALLLVLVVDPLGVLSPGLWLSFGAVAAILYGFTGRQGRPSWWQRWGQLQWVAALGLAPLLLALFQQVSVIMPVANLIAVPWVSIGVVPLVLIGTALVSWLPALAEPLLYGAAAALQGLWALLSWLAAVDMAQWSRAAPSVWDLGLGLAGVALLLAPRGLPGRWLGMVLVLPLVLAPAPRPPPGTAWVSLLDVGQGLSAVIQTTHYTLLYDAGAQFSPTFDAGRAAVVPFLRHQGIRHLDTVVVSHGDRDHAGGLAAVRQDLEVERLISGEPGEVGHGATACHHGQQWRWDGVRFAVLHPPSGHSYEGNAASCVLRVTSRDHQLLLTGDLEGRAERRLSGRARDLRARRF